MQRADLPLCSIAKMPSTSLLAAFFLFLVVVGCIEGGAHGGGADGLATYVVLVEEPEALGITSEGERRSWYGSLLSRVIGGESSAAGSRMIYSYGDVVSGFAARLSAGELEAFQELECFVAAFPDDVLPLLTTRSPAFLSLSSGADGRWRNAPSGEGVIIGMIDTGVASHHASFSGAGMPPPPARWKGRCEVNRADCNNKLVGYKVFDAGAVYAGDVAPRRREDDADGHGTHTASTAAGAPVAGVSVLGYANGTAVGLAPRAHLAIYKVCSFGCRLTDVMAGVAAAVTDGVDVLSISLGAYSMPFYKDGLAVAAFRAARRGVLVSCAAGNAGPGGRTLTNEAPWILTVAASTIDRSMGTTVKLGDGRVLAGESIFRAPVDALTEHPLAYPVDYRYSYCTKKLLSRHDVKGKVVLCDYTGVDSRSGMAAAVRAAGGTGMIVANLRAEGYSVTAGIYPIPAAHLSFSDGSKVKAYINSSRSPTVSFSDGRTVIGTSPAPVIASFSSRGPSMAAPGVLKPDVTGPGVDIIAAWPPDVEVGGGAAGGGRETPKLRFRLLSGTSMSTPHISGIAALVKSGHPDWSPAAVKSAIMTTADRVDRRGKPIVDEKHRAATLFAMGAGHVNPVRAGDPGLVYDLRADDYIAFLCKMGYSDAQAKIIAGRRVRCADYGDAGTNSDLNYPSIAVALENGVTSVEVRRTVTNVGGASSAFSATVEPPAGVRMTVNPDKLQFSEVNQRIGFTVSFSRDGSGERGFKEGHLIWVSANHVVRSPISVFLA